MMGRSLDSIQQIMSAYKRGKITFNALRREAQRERDIETATHLIEQGATTRAIAQAIGKSLKATYVFLERAGFDKEKRQLYRESGS